MDERVELQEVPGDGESEDAAALDRLRDEARDGSVAFNSVGDNQARLEDIGQGRVEAMDTAGIDVSIISVVTPATCGQRR